MRKLSSDSSWKIHCRLNICVNDEFDEEYCAEDYDGYYDIDDFQMKF